MSYLALYFEMILHENGAIFQNKKRRVAVVCTTGRGTAHMIKRQLKRVLGHDIEITQYSEENFNPDTNDNYFAVFTTIPLKLGQINSPVIQIRNLLMISGCVRNGNALIIIIEKNLKTIILTFSRLVKAASYQDYLVYMTQSLEALGLVDDHFEKRILDREKNNLLYLAMVLLFHILSIKH